VGIYMLLEEVVEAVAEDKPELLDAEANLED
jgi:hypothetical protein